MSDIEGTRPDPDDAASSSSSDTSTASTAPAQPAAEAPTSANPTPAQQSAPAAPPAPPTVPAYQAAAAPVSPSLPQPPYAGQAFGPAATAPTQPLTGSATAATATAPRKKSTAGRTVGLIVAAAIVGGAAGLGTSYAGTALWGPAGQTTASGGTVVTVNNTESVNNTTAVAAKVVPSVVTISATASNSAGTGSGVILSEDGYVLTNTHVVTLDGATANPTLSVTTSDGRIYAATIVGTDPTYDLAVIKLEGASGLTPVTWGDSTKLNVGDETVAIGAPLGLANTVTEGIVSALNRSIEIASSAAPDSSDSSDSGNSGEGGQNGQNGPFYFDFGQGQSQQTATDTIKIAVIQTDASINPGNSGGALVNSKGELVGINVAIASAGSSSSSSGQSGSIGVGFSIPSAVAQRVSQELIDNGKATHGLLGASVQDAANVKGATITGAYIADVTAGGPAAAAGLQKGDIVTQFNGASISGAVDLTAQVRALAAGSKASLTYVRDGKTQTATVTLGALQ